MPVAGALHDFPLLDVFNAVGHSVGRLLFTGLPTIQRLELDLHEGVITACRLGEEQTPLREQARLVEKLILASLAGTGDFVFHPTSPAAIEHVLDVPIPAALRDVFSKCDEIRASSRDFDPPMQKLRLITKGAASYTGELGDFLRETSSMLRRGTSANEIAQALKLAVPHVQFFLLFMKEEGLIAHAEPPPGRTRQHMMQSSFQAAGPAPGTLDAPPEPEAGARWFFLEREKEVGPVTEDVILHRLASGLMLASSLVWRQGLSRWTPYEEVRTLDRIEAEKTKTGLQPEGEMIETCYVSGEKFPRSEMMFYQGVWVHERHRGEFFKKLNSIGFDIRADRRKPAWLPSRFGAWVVDAVLYYVSIKSLWVALAGLKILAPGYFFSVGFCVAEIIGAVLWGALWLGLTSTTPGKWVFHLRVVNFVNDRHVRWGTALKRSIAALIPFGWVAMFSDPDGRAVHDKLAQTRVIHWTLEP